MPNPRYPAALILLALLPLTAMAQTPESDLLFDTGVSLYDAGRYDKAARCFAKSDSIDKATLPEGHSRREYSAMWLASCYHKMGNDDGAARYFLLPATKPVDRRLTVESDSLSDIGSSYEYTNDYASALEMFKMVGELERKNLGAESLWYGNTLSNQVACMLNIGSDSAEIANTIGNAVAIFQKEGFNLGLANMENFRGQLLMGCYNFAGAYDAFAKAREHYANAGDKQSAAAILGQMATAKLYLLQFDDVLRLADRAVDEIRAEIPDGDNTYPYPVSLSLKAIAELNLQRADSAWLHSCEAKPIFEALGDNMSMNYINNETCIANAARTLGKPETRRLFETVKKEYKVSGLTNTPEYVAFLQAYNTVTETDRLKGKEKWDVISEFLNATKNTYGDNSAYYFMALVDIALNYNEIPNSSLTDSLNKCADTATDILRTEVKVADNYMMRYNLLKGHIALYTDNNIDKALNYLKSSLAIADSARLTDTPEYANTLVNIAQIYNILGQNSDVYNSYSKALEYYERNGRQDDDGYQTVLNGMSQYFDGIGDKKRSDAYLSKALAAVRDTTDNDTYAMSLISYALRIAQEGNIDECKRVIEKAIAASSVNYRETMRGYGMFYMTKGYILNGDVAKAIETAEKSDKIITASLQEFSNGIISFEIKTVLATLYMLNSEYNKALSLVDKITELIKGTHIGEGLLSFLYQIKAATQFYLGDKEGTFQASAKAGELLTKAVTDNFRTMTYEERTNFWNKNSRWFLVDMPTLTYRDRDPRLLPLAYNSLLLSKGLLLNSEIEVRRLLAENGNNTTTRLYDEVMALRERLDKLAKQGGSTGEYDSLSKEAQDKERRLMALSKDYGDYTKRLTVEWTDVRDNLRDGEAAIEFTAAQLNADSTMYSALVLKKDSDIPMMINLCLESCLRDIPSDSLYTTPRLYDLVWKPLKPVLKGTKTVFFAPVARLYSTAVEYALMPDGKTTICEHYKLNRVSSTRELVFRGDKAGGKTKEVLYGGLEYDADPETLAEANNEQKDKLPRNRAVIDAPNLRGGVQPLDGTLIELEGIDSLMKAVKQEPEKYTGVYGTEETLKGLSGRGCTLLHIGTHGFYWDGNRGTEGNYLATMLGMVGDNATVEDQMLTQSGLLFAGANTILRGETVPDNQDDGILTARELSTLDLRGMDMVVLSACETALGKVNGEGVFGLQRGFKKAGAKTLMMSLWKVDDKATQMLMTEFYKRLLEGRSKTESLTRAQQYLRQYTENEVHPYDKPRYWAAFILLDAID